MNVGELRKYLNMFPGYIPIKIVHHTLTECGVPMNLEHRSNYKGYNDLATDQELFNDPKCSDEQYLVLHAAEKE